jgi:hypothetical protein
VSPMTYIRSLYPRDWDHFLERMAARLAGIEPSAVRSALSHMLTASGDMLLHVAQLTPRQPLPRNQHAIAHHTCCQALP